MTKFPTSLTDEEFSFLKKHQSRQEEVSKKEKSDGFDELEYMVITSSYGCFPFHTTDKQGNAALVVFTPQRVYSLNDEEAEVKGLISFNDKNSDGSIFVNLNTFRTFLREQDSEYRLLIAPIGTGSWYHMIFRLKYYFKGYIVEKSEIVRDPYGDSNMPQEPDEAINDDNKEIRSVNKPYKFYFKCRPRAIYSEYDVDNLSIVVELSNDEVTLIRNLVSQANKEDYEDNLIPLLKKDAPELHKRFINAMRDALIDRLVLNCIHNRDAEFKEEDLRRNFEEDLKKGLFQFNADDYYESVEGMSEAELKEHIYEIWYTIENIRIIYEDIEWLRSRYPVDDFVYLDDDFDDFTCVIPESFQL